MRKRQKTGRKKKRPKDGRTDLVFWRGGWGVWGRAWGSSGTLFLFSFFFVFLVWEFLEVLSLSLVWSLPCLAPCSLSVVARCLEFVSWECVNVSFSGSQLQNGEPFFVVVIVFTFLLDYRIQMFCTGPRSKSCGLHYKQQYGGHCTALRCTPALLPTHTHTHTHYRFPVSHGNKSSLRHCTSL